MSLMSTLSFSFLFLILVLLIPYTMTSNEYTYYSVHDGLRSYGLPAGLFPNNVKSYTLDETGFLEVQMHHPCLAQYETRVFFNSVVRTNLSFGQLKVFEGMYQEELFIWLPVKGIIVTDPSSGLIIIDIGLAYKHLSLFDFDNPPSCIYQGILQISGRKELAEYREEKFVYENEWIFLCWYLSIFIIILWNYLHLCRHEFIR
ncbi:uncharacterized protein LOC107483751 [Arachis duranensis]|uniref:Uncharacterized protein LOC107483751 n=1 Tax=Arachis duranensis TaxID=130453 RepID=A0A9C6TKS4_ARADU|nr:uncharacterized protein LOC107483751 [Arachis duranensis]